MSSDISLPIRDRRFRGTLRRLPTLELKEILHRRHRIIPLRGQGAEKSQHTRHEILPRPGVYSEGGESRALSLWSFTQQLALPQAPISEKKVAEQVRQIGRCL